MLLGKGKHTLSVVVFLFLSYLAGAQTGKNYKYQLNGNLQVITVSDKNKSLLVDYSLPEVNIENITNPDGSFYRISIPSHTPAGEPGKPELPAYSRLISVPDGAEYRIRITDVKKIRIKPSSKNIDGILIPAQESETKQLHPEKRVFRFDWLSYGLKGFLAADTVKIESLGTLRNKNLSNLVISPVRYNPHSNVIEVITSMKIEIIFTYGAKGVSRSQIQESTLFSESLMKGVLNYNPGDVIPGYSDQPVKMVIITDNEFKKQLEPFFKWKKQKGFKLNIIYKGTPGAGNTYTQLKDTLTKIYRSSTATDPPPEYLLIIGDVNRIPYYGAGGTGNVTDMYYGEFDGNGDYIPEMYVGRLPVADTTELKSVVQKLIQYEKFQYADTNKFYNYALVTAGNAEGFETYMNGQVNYAVTNYLTQANRITERHFYYPVSATSKDTIIKIINKGISFLNYTGHGDASGWLYVEKTTPPPSTGIKVGDIPFFSNRNMYPFVISNACRTAQYNLANSFGNKMVVSSGKGAIGFIGCSNDSYWDEDFYWSVGPGTITTTPTYEGKGLGAYDRFFHTHSESPPEWYFTMGQINYAGNLAVSASTSSRKKYYWETYNVIGDPSVIPITGKPLKFNVSLPDTLPNNLKSLTMSVDPFAYVAVSHFDALWDASFASKSGSVVLDFPGVSNDSCLFVITGQNRFPIIKTVRFANIKKEYINLTSTTINDINGNNNAKADFGESIFLKLKVSNLGSTDAQNAYVKIVTKSGWIKIITDSALIGTIPAKSETILSDKLGITVSDNVPDMSVATVDLMIKDNYTEKHYTVDIVIHSPDPQITNCLVDDLTLGNANYIADPGETFNLVFKVKNQGSSDVSGQFTVTSQSKDLTILQSSVKSGVLKFGETTDLPVPVKLSETVPSGEYIKVSSTLNCSPFLINKDFSFRVGQVRESFESSSFNVFPWINVSQIPWTITSVNSYDGLISARSGAISHNGTTSLVLKTVYSSADSLKFYYKVSSETSYDYMSFSLNGKEILKKSGEIPWTKLAISVPEGVNILEWKYKKDQSVSSGYDCAWIDLIDFTGSGTVSYIRKDLKVAKITAPVQKDKLGQETVTVKVLNTGKDILDGFNLAYTINDQSNPVIQHFDNKVIPDGDTVTVSFMTKADLTKYGIYNISTYGYDNNDDYQANDTLKISLENARTDESLSVYPNPFIDQLNIFINSPLNEKLDISLISISGAIINSIEKEVLAGKNTIVLTIPGLVPGTYYLRVRGSTTDKSVPVMKVIK